MKFVFALVAFFVLSPAAFPQGHTPPAVAAVQMTPDKWREDLRFLAAEIARTHKNAFHAISREEFAKNVAALDARIPTMEDHQIVVEMMRLVASVGDGHTGVRWGMLASTGMLPVNFYVYDDGVFVQRAATEYANIVGGKVTKVGGVPTDEAIAKLTPYIWRDNEMGIKSAVPWYFASPKILHAVGLSGSKDVAEYTIAKDGREVKVQIKPTGKLDDQFQPPVEWAVARPASAPVPHYLKERHNNFRFENLESGKTFYIQFNAVQNKPDETVEAFFNRAYEAAEKSTAERLVLDLRQNGGGNNYLNLPVIIGAIKSRLNVRGKFFVIIGRETFSAAMNTVNDLEKYTNATFVGEPTGASPNHYGDARNMTLLNSKLIVRASTLWWQDMDERDRRKWKAPDVAADLTSRAYKEGRDPAMEAIANYKPAQSLEAIIAEQRVKQDLTVFSLKVREFKANPAHKYAEIEGRLNDIGYFLLGRNQIDDAISVFKLNVELYPSSANTYDSLGEAYLRKGDRANALSNYKKALEIDPKMETAREAVRNLSQE